MTLIESIAAANTDETKRLLAQGADPNEQDPDARTALHHAASGGYSELVSLLARAGGDVNATEQSGWTPLMEAALNGQVAVVSSLLALHAKVNIKSRQWRGVTVPTVEWESFPQGTTALMIAALYGNLSAVQSLVNA